MLVAGCVCVTSGYPLHPPSLLCRMNTAVFRLEKNKTLPVKIIQAGAPFPSKHILQKHLVTLM